MAKDTSRCPGDLALKYSEDKSFMVLKAENVVSLRGWVPSQSSASSPCPHALLPLASFAVMFESQCIPSYLSSRQSFRIPRQSPAPLFSIGHTVKPQPRRFGCVGLLLNATSALVVGHTHPGHSHSHGHDHDHSKESDLNASNDHGINLHMDPITRSTNAALHAVLYHTLEPVAIQPPIGELRSHSRFYADPVVSLGISLIIFASAIPLTEKRGRILLEAVPVYLNLEKIQEGILSLRVSTQLTDVLSIHDLHVWHLSQSDILASLHVCVATKTSIFECSRIENHIQQCFEAYGIKHVTISPELLHLPSPSSYHSPTQPPSRTGSQRWGGHGSEGEIGTAGSGGSGPAASRENSDGDGVEASEGVSASVNVTGTCGIPIFKKEVFGCSMGRLRKVHRDSGVQECQYREGEREARMFEMFDLALATSYNQL
ncbi:hypothetical protein D9758_009248 [Tetrapyrgos nigripes]|uniref:Cation efflux protein cytoplasmic domain-containing protein n=1 Tax=Tetrapyrgos nigripes TaxID=182062 RepID=A0A8H5D3Q9_9AGAR|nr:hypothetical protein D9758_009248 [Tetrapyrgos nigripes]